MLRTLILICVIVWVGILCFAKSVQLDLSKTPHLERVNVDLDTELQDVGTRIKAAAAAGDQAGEAALLIKKGELLWSLRRFDQAQAATGDGIAIQEKLAGSDKSVQLVPALLTQAAIMRDQEKFADAREIYERIQAIDAASAEGKQFVARDFNNLALCVQLGARTAASQQDRSRGFTEAELLYRKAFDSAGARGATNKNVIANNLAALLDDMGRSDESKRWRAVSQLPKPF